VPELVAFVFQDAVEIDEAAWEKAIERNAWSADVLRDAVADYAGVPWEAEALKDATAAIAERHGVALRKAQAPVRVAVTGTTVGLPLFESLELLGREPVRARLEHALERVGAAPAR
jgi:glutamyl-tRNA synthetase